ncbi:plasma alpha-L-fucosidase [Nematostella vectensis]|uniref:plasma alpha-L-fucosidase n=1 Tax=Nematostella vectensis TaxID=45351 RepID=UPI0020770D11|nr:plasma alpha-L-fucosidase [Nematostella vectensis]
MTTSSVITLLVIMTLIPLTLCEYNATWKSLDARPLPAWYDQAKFGIFVHWGVFSVPGFGSEWFWYFWKGLHRPEYVEFMKKNYRPGFSYPDFGPMFKAEFYDPEQWADLFAKSGARYVVLTSKHHEGWTMWKSNVSWNWNAVDNGPHRDLVGDLAKAVRKTDVRFGLYHSLYEWFNPLFLKDRESNYTSQYYVEEILQHQLKDIVTTYEPDVVWADGQSGGSSDYWTSKDFLAWLYNSSPVKDKVVVNDRWGEECACHHGGFFTCHDHYNPGKLVGHKWENAMKLDKKSWGYRHNIHIDDVYTIEELLEQLVSTVSCGGNLLLNIGPSSDGLIIPVFQERLLQMGEWLKVNGEAIYNSQPWRAQNDSVTENVWYTSRPMGMGSVYAIALDWPSTGKLFLREPITSKGTVVKLLGYDQDLLWTAAGEKGILIEIPSIPINKMPSKWAYTFKMFNIE